ncbi:carbohydrate binding domain-containing protein [Fredinandcohnia sp. QZ13]|uniref:FIMAH domain-containing protein n=1 Tax=Fredinandcohnia sp. QZ13 TaxID=3073144 RepID=UPI0028531EB6|nr:carbohydrate binding domain-containing protein [Fredinandcohnia sp. QZ13]MDR4890100.1 carbohydrate binding domain-containing protein [Fredinandcohnia sp. QZ13]
MGKKRVRKLLSSFLIVMLFTSFFQFSASAETNKGETVVAKLNGRGFKEVQNLGTPATGAVVTDAVFGKENGKDVVYTTANGGLFNVIDVKNNTVLFNAQLGKVNQVWTHIIAPDGTVYIAGLADKNAGELWSYSPETKSVKNLGIPDASHQFWSSTTDDDGNVYIGTYKEKEGKIFKYDVSKQAFVDLGKVDVEGDASYVRSLTYHNGYLYAGLGVTGNVYRINTETLEKEKITKNAPDILGTTVEAMGFAYDMEVAGKYLVIRFSELSAILFYDLESQEWVEDTVIGKIGDGSEDDYGAFGYSQLAVNDNKTYVINNRHILEIDVNTLETRETGIRYPAGWRGLAFVDFGEASSDLRLVTVKRSGEIMTVDLDEKKIIDLPLAMNGNLPLDLHSLGLGPDGNLYMTTYPGGPKGARYNTKTGEITTYSQGQAEGMVAGNGSDMYFGIYSGASIQKMNTDTLEVKTLFNLYDEYEQDRPYIMKFENDKLLIGTIPYYQKLGGTLTIYDPTTGERETHRNIVQDQSIVGLAYKDGKIYGSTTVRGGLDIEPTAKKAKMFVWDVKGKKKITEFELDLPELDTPPMISGLTFDGEGLLWGAVDGILFAMDPDTYEIVKSKNLYPNIKNRGMWRPVHILFGEDGLLYTDIGGKLAVVDPKSEELKHVSLIDNGPEVTFMELAYDAEGNQNIYFIDGDKHYLKMIPVIDGGKLPVDPVYETVPVSFQNPGFEETVGEDNRIPGWSSLFSLSGNVSYGVTNERAKTGNYSLKIKDTAQNETVFVQSDPIPVSAGVEYTATVEMYLEDGSASFFVRYFDNAGKQVGKDVDGVNIIHVRGGHKQWQTVRATVEAPENAAYAKLFAGASNFFTTSGAYYDDFKLTYEREVVLDKVVLSADSAKVLQGEKMGTELSILLTNGEQVDLGEIDAVEWVSSSPQVATVDAGKIMANNAGTTDIQAIVTYQGEEFTSNKLTVTVTVTPATLTKQIRDLFESNQIDHSLTKQLTNRLDQAQHHYDKGDVQQAKKHLQDFIKHLNNSNASNEIKAMLTNNVNAIWE